MSIDQSQLDAPDDTADDDEEEVASRLAAFLPVGPRQWVAMAQPSCSSPAQSVTSSARATPEPGPELGRCRLPTGHDHPPRAGHPDVDDRDRRGREPGVQTFAREIVLFQSYEIGLMDRRLGEWGYRREQRPDTAMR